MIPPHPNKISLRRSWHLAQQLKILHAIYRPWKAIHETWNLIGIKIHVLEKSNPMFLTQGKPLKKNKTNLPCSFGAGVARFQIPVLSQPHPTPPSPPSFLWGDNLMLQWNGGLKRVKCRRSLWPLWRWRLWCWGRGVDQQLWNMTWWNSGEVLLYKSVSTWTNASGGESKCKNDGKKSLVRFHHFGVHDMVYKDGSGEQNPGKWSYFTEVKGKVEERTNTLLLCTRCGTSLGWRHLTSLEFAYMNWDAGADA